MIAVKPILFFSDTV